VWCDTETDAHSAAIAQERKGKEEKDKITPSLPPFHPLFSNHLPPPLSLFISLGHFRIGIRRDCSRQDRTRQDRTGQDRTGWDTLRQDGTGQDGTH
jgi:hypothetical protein